MRIRFHRETRSAPDTIAGLKVPYADAKRNAPKWRWRLILLAVLSPAILLIYSALQGLLTLAANGSVMLAQHEVRAPAAAQVAAIDVRLGADVRKGDVIARLQDPDLDAALARAQEVPRAPAVSSSRDHELLREELALHERTLRTQQQRAEALEQLVREGAATAAELREAQLAVDQASAVVLQTRQHLNSSTRTRPEPAVRGTDAAELERLLARRERLIIRAPESGRIVDVLAAAGQFVTAGEPLLLIGRSGDPQVIAYVSPEIAPQLSVGSRATIKFPDGTKAQATVAEQPMLTRRMPADLVDQFGMRPMTVVLHLQADREWPSGQRIHGLPVDIRFHYRWEG
jgi:HlyD family secretion protein